MKILVTGGAGFIGSHLVDGLIRSGHDVRILDSLVPQVHPSGERPGYVSDQAELVVGDVRDREAVAAALDGVDAVFHQAAAVGVGQSMYEIAAYCDVNVLGTAIVLEEVVKVRDRVRKVVVASSMSNYGEGRYRRESGEPVEPGLRPLEQFEAGQWELIDEETGAPLIACATDERKPMQPTSVYATTKRDQEELVLNVGRAYDIPSVALRYFNVYGTRQSLSNPYTGVGGDLLGTPAQRRETPDLRGRQAVARLHARIGHRQREPRRPRERPGSRLRPQRGGPVGKRTCSSSANCSRNTSGSATRSTRRSWGASARATSGTATRTSASFGD